jgi:hypothetical protein
VTVTDTPFPRDPNLRRPSDTPDTLDDGSVARVSDALEAAIRALPAR